MSGDRFAILILVIATAVGLTLMGPLTWLVLPSDGLLAIALLMGAAGWGAWPTAWLGFKDRSPAQQVCIATALGMGWLATAALLLGVIGLLNRPLAWILLAIGGALGLARTYLAQSPAARSPLGRATSIGSAPQDTEHDGPLRKEKTIARVFAAILLAPPLVIMLFGACLPPGMLWPEEANGYDVLEYHLEAPREYYDTGRIAFLPHNVYASFPQQMEMLYLLLMHLAGGARAAAIPAQLFHAACGILAVVALGCWIRSGWRRWLVVLIVGSTPWLAYLGCLAYVENGMLLFAAVAAGLILDCLREPEAANWRPMLTAGLCAGLAGGCKYTAFAFVAAALGIAWFVAMRASLRERGARLAIYALGAVVAVSPWLIRNAAFTGNPVYPFAYEWLGGKDWSAEQATRWDVAHRVPADRASPAGRPNR